MSTASVAVAAPAGPPPTDEPMQLRNVFSDGCADVERKSLEDGARVHQWRCYSVNAPNQLWRLEHLGGKDYKLKNENSKKCLDVYDRALERGMSAIQYTCRYSGDPSQRWELDEVERDVYRLINRNSGLCLDIKDHTTADGNHIHQWDCQANARNQRWVFRAVS
ncbi:RICIN domain-containing protein [Crossiella sp. SN42]|uniref:RICIN domain-containing protein n=1 Tax=Crossiella sp. SN42 TaxID=2944808 RepID=UPI00207C2338|nr:RICIN domain-containing protein [Crossiella sp. SN42]MCO1575286.1 RICIN domain-containing protein [Crossiella sp. SN42]